MTKPTILFIDAYDSFSNNIIALVEGLLDVFVEKITIDSLLPSSLRTSYAGIIIGPGPGSPYKATDVGCIDEVWKLSREEMVPVLGICLGFQSLIANHGGSIQRLPYPRHGIETKIETCNASIFKGIPLLNSVQYHSLYGSIGERSSGDSLWTPSETCSDLVPLAWDVDHVYSRRPPTANDTRAAQGNLNPRNILMSVKHASKPYYGVQFHSESVCSDAGARQMIVNWWQLALEWHREVGNVSWCQMVDAGRVFALKIPAGVLNVPIIRDHFRTVGRDIVVLDSEMNQASPMGNHSIVGLIYPDTLKITYIAGDKQVRLIRGTETITESLEPYNDNVFAFLKAFMEKHHRRHTEAGSPFWGGLMGYISYEACLETLGIATENTNARRPDIQFAFVERSIVIDHTTNHLHVQSIMTDDSSWVKNTASSLSRLLDLSAVTVANGEGISPTSLSVHSSGGDSSTGSGSSIHSGSSQPTSIDSPRATDIPAKFYVPSEKSYSRKIVECQQEIRQGNSYELCLTGQTEIDIPTNPSMLSSWSRYLRLRRVNPAPFGAYIRLGPVTVMSSSPERFMSWTRPDSQHRITCQFRPIKGTVRKQRTHPDGLVETVDRVAATKILSTPKERAENLMIVDLIRHDLAGVAEPGSVITKSLMQVEEYQSVFQLVTVIEGTLNTQQPSPGPNHGIDVLSVSLPPGSMTGAPKKRSCELLQIIEDGTPRSIYSGVLGYMDVGGGGDFSVVIRTAYRWDDECNERSEIWRVGAGGAITDMSNEHDEWDEMHTKVDAVLRSFKQVHTV